MQSEAMLNERHSLLLRYRSIDEKILTITRVSPSSIKIVLNSPHGAMNYVWEVKSHIRDVNDADFCEPFKNQCKWNLKIDADVIDRILEGRSVESAVWNYKQHPRYGIVERGTKSSLEKKGAVGFCIVDNDKFRVDVVSFDSDEEVACVLVKLKGAWGEFKYGSGQWNIPKKEYAEFVEYVLTTDYTNIEADSWL